MAIVELIMPKMGESIIEATIINWLKSEGDAVQADETILEIATDKVDSEVPSPVSGTIKKILFRKDDVVPIGGVLAEIETSQISSMDPGPIVHKETEQSSPTVEEPRPSPSFTSSNTTTLGTEVKATPATSSMLSRRSQTNEIPSNVDGRFYSPLVRNIARAEGITLEELSLLNGSGADDRVTKYDLLNYIDLKKLESTSSIKRAQSVKSTVSEYIVETPAVTPSITKPADKPNLSETPVVATSAGDELIELSRMRRVIASHMRQSIDTSAHVTTFVEADATRLVNWRNRVKNEYHTRFGEKLTFSPLFTEAVIKALRDHPQINASLDGDHHLLVKKSINIGIATAMENGNLIVPVIHDAGQLNRTSDPQRWPAQSSRSC